MAWFLLTQIFSTLLTLLRLGRTSEKDKDLEILILRQQLGIVHRHIDQPIKPNRAEKLTLGFITVGEVISHPAAATKPSVRVSEHSGYLPQTCVNIR